MTDQKRPGRYPAEMRERAVRMVFEAEQHTGSRWEAICSVAEKLGPTPETVRKWVQRVEIDEGRKPGISTDERQRLKELERENRELRRANEILKSASAGSSDQRNICSRAVAGVRKPRVLRGRVLSFSATASRSAWVSAFIDVPLGKY